MKRIIAIGNQEFLNMLRLLNPSLADCHAFPNHRQPSLVNLLNGLSENDEVVIIISESTDDRGGSDRLREDGFTTAFPFFKYILQKRNFTNYSFYLCSLEAQSKLPDGLIFVENSNSFLCTLDFLLPDYLEGCVNNNTTGLGQVNTVLKAADLEALYTHEIKAILSANSFNLPPKKSTLMHEVQSKLSIVAPILDDEQIQRDAISSYMSSVSANDDVFDAKFPVFASGNNLLQYLKGENQSVPDYGNVQAILLDWYMFETNNDASLIQLIRDIQAIRPNIFIYILTSSNYYSTIVSKVSEFRNVKYNVKGDGYDSLWETIKRDLRNRMTTPFWDAYKEYALNANYSWHTPGHSGGKSFKKSPYLGDFFNFFGSNLFKADLSVSVDSLGSLFSGSGKVQEAQEYASKVFGTKRSFFGTNGSSTSNKILLQYLLKPGDKAIVDRNCHKSVHYGLIHGNYKTVYLNSQYSIDTGFFAPPSKQSIYSAVENNMDAKVLILTGCTYDGIMMDLQDIIMKVKNINPTLKIMIDEAWFCYASFHYAYNQFSALNAGADYVTHSAHKVLSAFSQASYIHVNDPDFDENAEQYFMEAFCMNTSTSPQYNLIASLETAALQMEMEGFKLINTIRNEAIEFAKQYNAQSWKIKVMTDLDLVNKFPSISSDNCLTDPLKIVVDFSNSGLDRNKILKKFEQEGIQIEKSTKQGYFLLLYTIGSSASKTGELQRVLSQLGQEASNISLAPKVSIIFDEKILEIEYPDLGFHHYFYHSDKQFVNLTEVKANLAEGKKVYNCHLIVPYPPGIPILIPGTEIRADKCDYLLNIFNAGGEIHGIRNGKIAVIIEQP